MSDEQLFPLMEGYNSISSYLDETEFPVDLYEADSYYLAESLLLYISPNSMEIFVKDNYLTVRVRTLDNHIKSRTVYFPQKIENNAITSAFTDNILEVKIFKN